MYRSLMLVLVGLLAGGSAFAAEGELSAVVMDEVVVTATRQAEALDKVPANVMVINQEDIERSSAQNVPELLRDIAGVLVSDVTGNSRSYNVDLRGFGETGSFNTLVLIDGRRINQMDGSGVDWSLVPIDRVARIEVVRGGRGSVLYGDNAAGGIVNIITKAGDKDPVVTGGFTAGSYNSFLGKTSISGNIAGLDVALNGSYRTTDGYRDNSDVLAKDIGLNLGYEFTDSLFVKLDGGYHEDDTNLPGYLFKSDLDSGVSRAVTIFPEDYANTKDWYLRTEGQFYFTENSYFSLSASSRNREYESANILVGYESNSDTELETLAFSPQLVFNKKILGLDSNLQVGYDFEESKMDTSLLEDYGDWGMGFSRHKLSKQNSGLFTHAEINVSESLSLSGGFRKDWVEYEFTSVLGATTGSKKSDENLYTVGLNYLVSEEVTAYASYSKSFRYPHLDELYTRYSNEINEDLEAQTADDYEVGLRYKTKSDYSLSLNLFHVTTSNEIYLKLRPSYSNENLDGKTIRKGAELSFQKNIKDLHLSANYTYTNVDIDGGVYDGKEWPYVPKHRFSVGMQKDITDKVVLGINGSYVGKRRLVSDIDNTHERLQDYFYLTSKLSYLFPNGSVFLIVNNLLDEEYAEYGVEGLSAKTALYPSPPINFNVGVEFRF